jgi:hypothetical protein
MSEINVYRRADRYTIKRDNKRREIKEIILTLLINESRVRVVNAPLSYSGGTGSNLDLETGYHD